MKELANFITDLVEAVKSSANARLIFYLLVTAAVILAFFALPDNGVDFVYKNF
jgi:hypothetical protein